jgi:hypothetical protein
MEGLKEEGLKQDLMRVIAHYTNEEQISLGTTFYILKDVFNEIGRTYDNYIKQQLEKQKQSQEAEQSDDEEEMIALEGEVEE